MMILAYSGVELSSKKGLEVLLDFAKRNDLMTESVEAVVSQLILAEEEVAAEMMSDYWDTLMSARPNCFD